MHITVFLISVLVLYSQPGGAAPRARPKCNALNADYLEAFISFSITSELIRHVLRAHFEVVHSCRQSDEPCKPHPDVVRRPSYHTAAYTLPCPVESMHQVLDDKAGLGVRRSHRPLKSAMNADVAPNGKVLVVAAAASAVGMSKFSGPPTKCVVARSK